MGAQILCVREFLGASANKYVRLCVGVWAMHACVRFFSLHNAHPNLSLKPVQTDALLKRIHL